MASYGDSHHGAPKLPSFMFCDNRIRNDKAAFIWVFMAVPKDRDVKVLKMMCEGRMDAILPVSA
jgi:hypothetical protein